jgi:hypothetical protein
MRFTPKTEQELQAMSLVEPGQYSFQVVEAQDQVAKSGNEMIKLKLKIWDNAGRERLIFDYVLEAMAFKLRHFCDATGLTEKYESGELRASDCPGKAGKLELALEQGKQKPEGGYYPDKNTVKDYIKPEGAVSKPAEAPKDEFDSQDIPF